MVYHKNDIFNFLSSSPPAALERNDAISFLTMPPIGFGGLCNRGLPMTIPSSRQPPATAVRNTDGTVLLPLTGNLKEGFF
ncbi:MAG: hypothetical protein R2788_12300 [Saprospiraceae bacterium]